MNPRFCILRTDGTNCDEETAHAVRLAGGEPVLVHINELRRGAQRLDAFQGLILPGGFSYGDDVASGRILALELMSFLRDQILAFRGPVLGICNGFQVLVTAGLLPGSRSHNDHGEPYGPVHRAALTHNASGKFQCEWTQLFPVPESTCPFIQGLGNLSLQIAHGEGRFVTGPETLEEIESLHLVVLRYQFSVNGSMNDIAGICDPSRRIFGLMPHPERFVDRTQHPKWRRFPCDGEPHGLRIFRNMVRMAR